MVEVSFLTCQHAMAVPKPTIKGRVYVYGKRMIVMLCLGFWVVVYFPKLCLAFSLTWLLSQALRCLLFHLFGSHFHVSSGTKNLGSWIVFGASSRFNHHLLHLSF